MNLSMRLLKLIAVISLVVAFPCAANAETSSPGSAIQIVDVVLGTHVDSKKRIPVPYQSFRPSEPRIVASVRTFVAPEASGDASIGALWTFDTPEGPQTVIDASAELEFEGEGYTVFQIDNIRPWPIGTYHVAIYVEGVEVSKTTFTVK